MTKRSRLEICFDVLNTINSGIDKPTHIMNKCNLSYGMFSMVIKDLTAQGVIKKEKKGKRALYEMTDRGKVVHKYLSDRMENPPSFLIIPQSYLNGDKKHD